jgi:hypothetical protein
VRLIVSALVIIVGFCLGVWGIASLLPGVPPWGKVTLSLVCLFVLIVSIFFLGNKRGSTQEERLEFKHILGDNLLYMGIAVVPITGLIALAIHDLDAGVHRNIRQNWVLCTMTAGVVLAFSIEQFWHLRRCWQMWAVLTAYATLHFSIGVPALAHLQRIRAGYVSLIAMPELMLIFFVLYFVEANKQIRSC